DQPGVPLVTVEPMAGGKVRLSQRRFLTIGQTADDASVWRIPVILRYPAPDGSRTLRVWLTRRDTVADLGLAASPAWIAPNADASGYYRWIVPASMLDAMVAARAQLTVRERIDLIADLTALLRAGLYPGDRYLENLALLADDARPEVVRGAVLSLGETQEALE